MTTHSSPHLYLSYCCCPLIFGLWKILPADCWLAYAGGIILTTMVNRIGFMNPNRYSLPPLKLIETVYWLLFLCQSLSGVWFLFFFLVLFICYLLFVANPMWIVCLLSTANPKCSFHLHCLCSCFRFYLCVWGTNLCSRGWLTLKNSEYFGWLWYVSQWYGACYLWSDYLDSSSSGWYVHQNGLYCILTLDAQNWPVV